MKSNKRCLMTDSDSIHILFPLIVTTSVLCGSIVAAQEAPIEEVVVTAQKREQNLQDVPLSITAFSATELKEYGFNNLRDIASQTPNVHLTGFFQYGRAEIVIRGLSLNDLFSAIDASPVGVYNDEVYAGSRSGLMSQMYDLERVEILRGPQGTLYGRNTTGGAINFISRKPSAQPNAEASVSYGRYDAIEGAFAGGMPLSDSLSARIAVTGRTRDGYTRNEFTGKRNLDDLDSWAARGQVRWAPDESMEWILKVTAAESDSATPTQHSLGLGNGEPNQIFGYQENPDFHTLSVNNIPEETLDKFGVTLTGTIDLDIFGGVTLTSLTNYEETDYTENEDTDASPVDKARFSQTDDHDQILQEFRLTSTNVANRLRWIAGMQYYTDEVDASTNFTLNQDPVLFPLGFFPVVLDQAYIQESAQWAVFGDANFDVTSSITLNAGLRYTHEKKDFDLEAFFFTFQTIDFVDEKSWDALTGRIGLDWKPTDELLLYGGYSRGFKSGGFNGSAFTGGSELDPFDPEFVDAFEIGAKSTWYDGRLIANGSIFYTKVDDMQALVVDVSPFGFALFPVINAAKAEIFGAEFEFKARPVENLFLQLGIGLLDTKYNEFITPLGVDLSGNELPSAPNISVSTVAQYEIPFTFGIIVPRLEFSHRGEQYFDPPNTLSTKENAYDLLNASLTWRSLDERWGLALWITNATDEEYSYRKLIGTLPTQGTITDYRAAPRMYGVTLTARWD